MCPGGVVVPAASEAGLLCVNGMSNYARDGENANSALVVTVGCDDFGSEPLAGMNYQRRLEERAFAMGGYYHAPIQLASDFLAGISSDRIGNIRPTYPIGHTPANLTDLLDAPIITALQEALMTWGRKIPGFAGHDAILTAIESRTSSPIRIPRNASLNANIKGILPCGEGAGHAGGIISAAIDGIRCAEAVLAAL